MMSTEREEGRVCDAANFSHSGDLLIKRGVLLVKLWT